MTGSSSPTGVGGGVPRPQLASDSPPLRVMRRLPVVALLPGQPIPFSVHYPVGTAAIQIAEAGWALKAKDFEDLSARGIDEVWVPESEARNSHRYLLTNFKALFESSPRRARCEPHQLLAILVTEAILSDLENPAVAAAVETVVSLARDLADRGEDIVSTFESRNLPASPLAAHSFRVCVHGLRLAGGAGLEGEGLLEDLGRGLLLHDLGKIGASSVECHVERGVEKAREFPWLGDIACEVIELHHERHDGSGDSRLSGKSLPLSVRIASVVDGFDHRTFDDGGLWSQGADDALREMIASDHGNYDPRLLALMIRTLAF